MSDPRICVSNTWLEPLTPRAYLQLCNLPYILSPLPWAHVRTWIILFPSYHVPCGSFLESNFGNLSAFSNYFFELIFLNVDGFFLFFIFFFSFEDIWFTIFCFRCSANWFSFTYTCIWTSHLAQLLKNHPAMKEIWVQSLGWEDMFRGTCRTSPVFLPAESHGQRSLAGYSP